MVSAEGGRSDLQVPADYASLAAALFSKNVVSFISHEVGNPVSSLKGFLDIILDGKAGPLTPLQAEFLALAKVSTGRLCRILDDVSDLSLLARNAFRLERDEIRLGAVVARVIEQLGPLASGRQVQLGNQFPGKAPVCHVDAKRMERALYSLMVLALQFTSAGGRISISGEALESKVLLFITGMEATVLPDEYLAVFAGDLRSGSSGRRCDATWLGLVVARQAVEHHGGSVWLDKGIGGVARICLSLPLGP